MKTLLQKQAAIEACIVELLAQGPQNGTEIRQYVQAHPSCVWASSLLIRQHVERMLRSNRVELHYVALRSVPSYKLPTNPELPFASHSPLPNKLTISDPGFPDERKLPRWFYIPSGSDLYEPSKTRSGYDTRSDYMKV